MSLASNKKSDSGVEESALQLFIAIGKCDYKKIEELVKAGRKKGLLDAKNVQGNTFIHQVAYLISERRFSFGNEDISDIDYSAPLIQKVIHNSIIPPLHSFNFNNHSSTCAKLLTAICFHVFADFQ